MAQIITTQNLVVIKVVRHAGQKLYAPLVPLSQVLHHFDKNQLIFIKTFFNINLFIHKPNLVKYCLSQFHSCQLHHYKFVHMSHSCAASKIM